MEAVAAEKSVKVEDINDSLMLQEFIHMIFTLMICLFICICVLCEWKITRLVTFK